MGIIKKSEKRRLVAYQWGKGKYKNQRVRGI